MTTAYGKIKRDTPQDLKALASILPIKTTLKTGQEIIIDRVPKDVTVSDAVFSTLHWTLNEIIEEGLTYPQETILDETQFRDYFLSYDAFYARSSDSNQVLGGFYVKPNYPGRCSHICNGGFIVHPSFRSLGVGKHLARAFLLIAPQLGYSSSVFNLVFENNVPSVKIWRGLGFKEIGRVPGAGRLKGVDGFVDAIVFWYDFGKVSTNNYIK